MSCTSSTSTSILPAEDSTAPYYPATRALWKSRRQDIENGLDSISSLMSKLRLAQTDAESELARAVKERKRLVNTLRNHHNGDKRLSEFAIQLDEAENRCSGLHRQLNYMKKMYQHAGEGKGMLVDCKDMREESIASSSGSEASRHYQRSISYSETHRERRATGGDSGIDEDSDDIRDGLDGRNGRDVTTRMLKEERYNEDQRCEEKNLGRTQLPFVTGQATTPSHHLGANIQQVLALMKKENPRQFTAPPPVPSRQSRSRSRRHVYQRSSSQRRSRSRFTRFHIPGRYQIDYDTTRPLPEGVRSSSTDALFSDKGIRRSKKLIKGLLHDLYEELTGLENACESLTELMDRTADDSTKSSIGKQLCSYSTIIEERQRQISNLSSLYRQVKDAERCLSAGPDEGPCAGYPVFQRRGIRGVATRFSRKKTKSRGGRRNHAGKLLVTSHIRTGRNPEPHVPEYLKWRLPKRRPRPPPVAVSSQVTQPRSTKVKILRDMKVIQKGMKVNLGEDRELSRPYVRY